MHEEIPTPIESDSTTPDQPKEKRYQFRNTCRAWKSKYRAHAGRKQFRKALIKLCKTLSTENLTIRLDEITSYSENLELHPNLDPEKCQITLEVINAELSSRKQNEISNQPTS